MNIDVIRELIEKFNHSDISKMNVEFGDIKVSLEKGCTQTVIQNVQIDKDQTTCQPEDTKENVSFGKPVKAPLVGVFYSKSSPDAKPFVEVGQHVQAGDTLCIIEAMKVMNEIKAPMSGTIDSILVEDEALVEFDQVIMTIVDR